MATQSTYSWVPEATAGETAAGTPEAAEHRTAGRLGWRVSVLFILGVSLLCWGLIVMVFGALIG